MSLSVTVAATSSFIGHLTLEEAGRTELISYLIFYGEKEQDIPPGEAPARHTSDQVEFWRKSGDSFSCALLEGPESSSLEQRVLTSFLSAAAGDIPSTHSQVQDEVSDLGTHEDPPRAEDLEDWSDLEGTGSQNPAQEPSSPEAGRLS